MFRRLLAPAAALLAAAATTLSLFSAVAGLADGDRALLLAAKRSPALIAGNAPPVLRQVLRRILAEVAEVSSSPLGSCDTGVKS